MLRSNMSRRPSLAVARLQGLSGKVHAVRGRGCNVRSPRWLWC
jgi:hypothetical protein